MPDGVCPFANQILGVIGQTPGNGGRVGFCDHAAGGFFTTLQSVSFWNERHLSVHFGISRRGDVCQIVNIFDTAFAQGRLGPVVSWPPYNEMGQANPNLYLISTEHEDAETVNGKTHFIPGSEWTEEEYQADLRVKRWCIGEVKRVIGVDLMRFGLDSLAGHHMFDSVDRAECPGRFWRDEYRARLFSDLQGDDDMMIRHNAIGAFWSGQTIAQQQQVNTRIDFALPPEAKRLRLEFFIRLGRVEVYDGGTKAYAGQAGWGGVTHQYVDVFLDEEGLCYFAGRDNAITELVGCVGYWT